MVFTLFSIKDMVVSVRSEVKEVAKQIQRENDMIHLFKAELSYLSSPERLHELNNKYLALQETTLSQMIVDPLKVENNPEVNDRVLKLADSALAASKVKWRYRKNSKHLTLVADKSGR
jgi:hypothetical protein